MPCARQGSFVLPKLLVWRKRLRVIRRERCLVRGRGVLFYRNCSFCGNAFVSFEGIRNQLAAGFSPPRAPPRLPWLRFIRAQFAGSQFALFAVNVRPPPAVVGGSLARVSVLRCCAVALLQCCCVVDLRLFLRFSNFKALPVGELSPLGD